MASIGSLKVLGVAWRAGDVRGGRCLCQFLVRVHLGLVSTAAHLAASRTDWCRRSGWAHSRHLAPVHGLLSLVLTLHATLVTTVPDGCWRPHLAVLTELESDLCDDWGRHGAAAGQDWGYRWAGVDRRKVVLWSKRPLVNVTRAEEHCLPESRLVAATTETPVGPVRVVAVCVPWHAAHVSTGCRDLAPWEDHLTFLRGLRGFVDEQHAGGLPVLVDGDINQALSLKARRWERYAALAQTVDVENAPTRGLVGAHPVLQDASGLGDIAAIQAEVVIAAADTGRRHSDHDFIVVGMRRSGQGS
jgi:hypothetical protein